jgi:DNA primase
MARIPAEALERIKRETDLVVLVGAGGVELRRHGKDWLGLCPLHDDHEPSLVVTPEKGLWHCLGACGTGGSAIDWVMKREGVGFREAAQRLLAGLGASVPVRRVEPEPVPVVEADAADAVLLAQVVDYYHRCLKETPRALEYLESRGLTHPEMVDRFRIGFADRTLGLGLPGTPQSRTREEVRERLQRLGILRRSGHEHFRGSVVIPVFGGGGEVLEIYGRTLIDSPKRGMPSHRYLPGPHRGVWNGEALRAGAEVILCESLLDALTFWCAGFRNVTASYGVNGFTRDHVEAIRASGIRRVRIAYDADAAGDRGAETVVAELAPYGIECLQVQFPWGQDANGYALAHMPASESLGALLERAVPIGEAAAVVVPVAAPMASAAVEDEAMKEAAKEETKRDLPPLAAEPEPAVVASPEITRGAASESTAAVPPTPAATVVADVAVELRPEEVVIPLGERRYRVRGLAKNLAYDVLRVNLLARRHDGFHVDTLDLYAARARAAFVSAAAAELGVKEEVVKRDLGRVLLVLEELQDRQIRDALTPKESEVTMTEAERSEALALLRAPDLLARILTDFERCGTVGEEVNKLVGYLAAVSRKLERPLAVILQSASAAGKTSLMDAVLAFVPEEERVQYSALTGQSLFYMEGTNLKHKVLAVVEEEGAERASYALKLLQSEGELTIASTGKDPHTGKLVTHEYRVEGPVMIFLTTTAVDLDEELLNRCLVLTVDEDREQTRRVHQVQRERRTLEGLLARRERDALVGLHRNAQRLLRPLAVMNPYAPHLTFLDDRTRTRRDHEKYLTLIDTIALLHQHQRSVQRIERDGRAVEYIEATLADIAHANRLADAVLGRSLDELAPQSRTLLGKLEAMVVDVSESQQIEQAEVRFTRKDVRHYTGWSDFQVRTHLAKLESLEYVLAHRGGPGSRYTYELLYRGEGAGGGHFLMGLVDVKTLEAAYGSGSGAPSRERSKENSEGSGANCEGSAERLRAPIEGGVSSLPNRVKSFSTNGFRTNSETARKRASGAESQGPAHPHTAGALAASAS